MLGVLLVVVVAFVVFFTGDVVEFIEPVVGSKVVFVVTVLLTEEFDLSELP